MMRLLTVIAAAAVVALGGCAKDNIEPPAKLESFPSTLEVSRAWSVNLAGTGRTRVGLSPATDGRNIYAAGRNGRVVAVALDGGQRLWQSDVNAPLAGGPGFGDGLVVVGGIDGSVVAIDAETGALRWTAQLSSAVLAAPAVGRGIVVARTGDGRIHGLDAGDGGELWTYEQQVPTLSLRGAPSPVINGELVITGFDNGRVTANQLRDGQLVWETPLGIPTGRSEVERMVDINASPRVVGRDVYAVGYQGRLAVMALETGRILWAHDMSSSAGLGVAALGVWVTDADSEVVGFDRLSGSQMWRQSAMRARSLTGPAPVADVLALGDFDGFVHFLSQETGELLARVRAGRDAIHATPLVVGDHVIVQTSGGAVVAYRVGG